MPDVALPEKRKVGGSPPPLTTSFGQLSSALTSANAYHALWCLQPLSDHDCPCVTVVARLLSHTDRTSRPSEASLDAHALLPLDSPHDRPHCAGMARVRSGQALAWPFRLALAT